MNRNVEKIPELMYSGDARQLFMFVRREDGIYIFYKLDILDLYRSSNSGVELLPLIVFEPGVLPNCECSFAYIEPYFYIVGQKKDQVFTLKRDRVLKLVPSEEYRGRRYLNPTRTPMSRDKLYPLAFDYKNNLYVLSKTTGSASAKLFDLEVYSPSTSLWRVLARKPLNGVSHNLFFQSHLVLGTKVYFTTSVLVVVCFDLDAEMWNTVFDPYGALTFPTQYIQPQPLFESQTQVIGNRVFGIFRRLGSGHSDICASSSWMPHEIFFLRPNLAPDKKFFHDLFVVPTEVNPDISAWQTYMFTLDQGARIMGVVCYSSDMLPRRDELYNFATLSIFQIDAEPYPSSTIIKYGVPSVYWDPGTFFYAKKEDHVEYFKAKLLQRTFLSINTEKQFTYGIPCSCFFV